MEEKYEFPIVSRCIGTGYVAGVFALLHNPHATHSDGVMLFQEHKQWRDGACPDVEKFCTLHLF
jgi:hypothetical protein